MVTHLGKTQPLPSLGETRFGSIFTLFQACIRAKPAFVGYGTYGLKDSSFDCDLPEKLVNSVKSRQFWYSISAALHFLRPIVWLIGNLEGDAVPCSATVAAFLFVKNHLHCFPTTEALVGYRDVLGFDRYELQRLLDAFDRRWLRIRHPILYVCFMLDPLFLQPRLDGITELGQENVQIATMKARQ